MEFIRTIRNATDVDSDPWINNDMWTQMILAWIKWWSYCCICVNQNMTLCDFSAIFYTLFSPTISLYLYPMSTMTTGSVHTHSTVHKYNVVINVSSIEQILIPAMNVGIINQTHVQVILYLSVNTERLYRYILHYFCGLQYLI